MEHVATDEIQKMRGDSSISIPIPISMGMNMNSNMNMNMNIIDGGLYNDLVQEGVVTLMKCMVVWDNDSDNGSDNGSDNDNDNDNDQSGGEDFESFAAREISASMRKIVGGGSPSPRSGERVVAVKGDTNTDTDLNSNVNTNLNAANADVNINANVNVNVNSVDQIMNPLGKAVLDENPTPDEIALSEMIRHDICDFLERTLNTEELKVIRMRFGLEVDVEDEDEDEQGHMGTRTTKTRTKTTSMSMSMSTSLEDIALNLSTSIGEVQNIERAALAKLRTSFSNDYIGAYLDDDNTEEVSL